MTAPNPCGECRWLKLGLVGRGPDSIGRSRGVALGPGGSLEPPWPCFLQRGMAYLWLQPSRAGNVPRDLGGGTGRSWIACTGDLDLAIVDRMVGVGLDCSIVDRSSAIHEPVGIRPQQSTHDSGLRYMSLTGGGGQSAARYSQLGKPPTGGRVGAKVGGRGGDAAKPEDRKNMRREQKRPDADGL